MLTDKPNIVIAKPPCRIRRKPKAAPASIIVDARKELTPITDDEHDAWRAAADRLWQEISRRVAGERDDGEGSQ